ncbi:hypothetical protein AB0M02_40500 [Actinoplanes sp. NPDC051861]|uniref:hypothetical protein n=1 Tax=Actinoplanes sp. NPDC051861 TaxID=3155170 RepID=UPI003416C716
MADIIVTDQAKATDPAMKALTDRVATAVNAAATKATANMFEPARYPLPKQATSLEQVLRTGIQKLPAAARPKSKTNVLALVGNKAAWKKQFGGIDLGSAVAVDEQLAATAEPLDLSSLQIAEDDTMSVDAMAAATPVNRELALRIHRVTCKDETSEIGKDEIYLGGTSVDENADTKTVKAFKVDSFSTGKKKVYTPPRQFTFFNVREGGAKFPKTYTVVLVMIEHDMGDLAGFLNKLADAVRDRLRQELVKLGTKGPIEALIALGLSIVMDKVFGWLKSLWGDEVFNPRTLSVKLPTATHRFPGNSLDSPEGTLRYKGHGGEYEVVYDWQLKA